MRSILTVLGVIIIASAFVVCRQRENRVPSPSGSVQPVTIADEDVPLPRARTRVIKKPFGLYVSPGNSPVYPERFSGYHTGTDFEVLDGETPSELTARAPCDGAVVFARRVSGYGGVVMQSCTLNQTAVRVLYGHLAIESLPRVGRQLTRGDAVGVLGTAYSYDTDGERAHLHLSVLTPPREDLRGYVSNAESLASWMNPLDVLTK